MRARDQMRDSIVSSRVDVENVFIRYRKIRLSENIFFEEERNLGYILSLSLIFRKLELSFIPCRSHYLTYWNKEIINK